MSYNVIIDDEAQEDLRAEARWIAQHSPEKATLWYFDIPEAIESLENFPFRCPVAPEAATFGTEIRHLIFGKFRILFTVTDENVHVLRVRHQAQDALEPDAD